MTFFLEIRYYYDYDTLGCVEVLPENYQLYMPELYNSYDECMMVMNLKFLLLKSVF